MTTAPITVQDIDDRLVGLHNWREAARRSPAQYTDQKIQATVPAWIRTFERNTTFTIYPTQVVSAPDGSYNLPTAGTGTIASEGNKVTGTGTAFRSFFQAGQLLSVGGITIPVASVEDDQHLTLEDAPPSWNGQPYSRFLLPVVQEAGYPYYPTPDADEYFVTTFRRRPILSVQRVRMMFNGRIEIYRIPPEWFSVDPRAGRFWLLPYYGSLAISNAAGAAAAYSMTFSSHLPNFLFFDYQAGLPDGWHYSHEWKDLKLVLAKHCALQILKDIDHAIDSGLTSKSVQGAGIGQTFSYDRFVQKKQELEADVKAFGQDLTAQETPFMLSVV